MKSTTSNLPILTFMALLISACGSRSTDFSSAIPESENPLPPCPESPNCVRTTRTYPVSIDSVWNVMLSALKEMRPYDVEITADEYRVDAVFLVVFFRDDVTIKLEEAEEDEKTNLHIRSSSRIGYSDFGVNTRRVKEFFNLIES